MDLETDVEPMVWPVKLCPYHLLLGTHPLLINTWD